MTYRRRPVTLTELLLYELEQEERQSEEQREEQAAMTTTPPPRPTRGQQRILQLCCRVDYALVGERVSGVPRYRIEERGTGRVVMAQVSIVMVTQLTQRGWLSPVTTRTTPNRGSEAQTWRYVVTEAGIAAANAPRE